MRPFLVYTGLRLLLFVATFVIVSAVWALVADGANWFWSAIVSFLISGVASFVVLDRPRQELAAKVEHRAGRKLDSLRSKEDTD